MNKTRKILFFDIDGTLITDDGKRYFPDSAKGKREWTPGIYKYGKSILQCDRRDQKRRL